ncbi:hypothetical protein VC83_03386 [Pseudogymnoascus destructans]|uniref:RBR-type E3 ubiquitin transferase n=1 Tax=Pseudogymnoascus destructans TaxID=655981 RepID=A0A177AEA2_9PEZI|nr:uncharacterized protein VC83_03386 [Pseudogymnoascus destructans]OAF60435.1 hypothetical protein VC83_03386 [Pseudogymnoascus destructans]
MEIMSGIAVEKKKSSSNRRRTRGGDEERRRRREEREREGRNIYVYAPAREKRSPRRQDVRVEACSGEEELSAVEEERSDGREREERRSSGHRRRRRLVEEEGGARHRSSASLSRSKTSSQRKESSQPFSFLRRTLSSASARPDARPVIKRAHTTSNTHLPKKTHESTGPQTPKRSIFLDMFTPAIKEEEPVKLVECLTCLSDDIPRRKSAKLKCGHRMCHSCLRRIFKLSVTDPQHMPPKCCTADCIPLNHVDKLFDIPFKKLWNRKFQEYTTKNRIYCPSRRCGEWIRPGSYGHDGKGGGGKFGKCGRCKTKVCILCSGKWHGKRECPGDEETNRLLEAAKEAGWQRCYSCRTMVELKEGCNHMTCRCTAEFCMLCGLKWKICACPWFNYDNIADNDRLGHMRVHLPPPPPRALSPPFTTKSPSPRLPAHRASVVETPMIWLGA